MPVGVARFGILVNPGMHGVQYSGANADPERAEQVDATVRTHLRAGCAYAGVRYLNDASRLERPGEPLSDRNAGVGIVYGVVFGCRRSAR